MKKWPEDSDYGIMGYTWRGRSIGGRIKANLDDFLVNEIDPMTKLPIAFPPEKLNHSSTKEGGLFLIGRVWKRGIDHARMIRLVAKEFGVKEDDVSTAGIKDAKAVTVQLFSVYRPRMKVKDPTQPCPRLEIDSFHYSREYIWPGAMEGNKFDIIVRNANKIEINSLEDYKKFVSNGLLNFYGYQRFGSKRPITAQFGRFIVNSKFNDAIDIYLGGKSANPDDDYFRKLWRENQDPNEILIQWNKIPIIEKDILIHLSKKPNDYVGAMRKFPNFLINIAKSSFVSLLTNHYLSKRGTVEKTLPGERERKNNIEIALPSNKWVKPLNEIWKEVFDFFKVDFKREMKQIRHTSRFLKFYPTKWRHKILDENSIKVSFNLPHGAYATIVLRELMQQPPQAYF